MRLTFKQFLEEQDAGTDTTLATWQNQLMILQQQLGKMAPQKQTVDQRYSDLEAKVNKLKGLIAQRQSQIQPDQKKQQDQQQQQQAQAQLKMPSA